MRISIRKFTLLTILPLVGLSNAVVAFILLTYIKEAQIQQFVSAHSSNARSLAPTLGFAIWEFNVERASNTLLGLDDGSAFRFARLLADGSTFAQHGVLDELDNRLKTVTEADWIEWKGARYILTNKKLIIRQPVGVVEKNRNVGELIIGFSLDPLLSQRQELATQVVTFLSAGTLAVYLGMLAYAFVSTKWLDRVRKSIMRLADGELGENEGSKTPIAEFQDIDDALKQLRLDALELIELQSKARADERIRYVAMHDPLTDLYNRRRLDEYAEQFSTNLPEQSDWLEILHIDLDGFKDVNDKSGHHAGDTVLKIAGRRLRQLRSSAKATDIFRVGGDEFVVVCRHESRAAIEAEPLALAQDVVESLGRPYIAQEVDDASFVELSRVSASVGVTIAPIQDLDLESSLTEADMAMYAAKAQGKNTCVLFTPELRDARTERTQLIADLEQAISSNALVPFYQPKVDSQTFELCGAEALVRWPHPTRGLVSPAKFLNLAEERGFLRQIDRMIFEQVCEDVSAWERLGYHAGRVSINLSGPRLLDPNLSTELQNAKCDLNSISFELLETIYLDDVSNEVTQRLDDIRSHGITIELDDFGSGHASMVSLLQIAPDRLKLDQLLVRQLGSHSDSERFLSQIVGIGKSLGVPTTAEGVETLNQAHILAQLGCDVLQGHYFARPMPAEKFIKEYFKHDSAA